MDSSFHKDVILQASAIRGWESISCEARRRRHDTTERGSLSKSQSPNRFRNCVQVVSFDRLSQDYNAEDVNVSSLKEASLWSGLDDKVLPAIAELTTCCSSKLSGSRDTGSEEHMGQQHFTCESEDCLDHAGSSHLVPIGDLPENDEPTRLSSEEELDDLVSKKLSRLSKFSESCTQTSPALAARAFGCLSESSEADTYAMSHVGTDEEDTFKEQQFGVADLADTVTEGFRRKLFDATSAQDSQNHERIVFASERCARDGASSPSEGRTNPPPQKMYNPSFSVSGPRARTARFRNVPLPRSVNQDAHLSILDASLLLGIGPSDEEVQPLVEMLLFSTLPRENVINLSVERAGSRESRAQFIQTLQRDGGKWSQIVVTWHLAPTAADARALSRSGIPCDKDNGYCGRYGLGGYVALSAAKANAYVEDAENDSLRHLLLVLALPGSHVVQGARGAHQTHTAADNAVCPTEYCFSDTSRIHCACLLTYQWVPTANRAKRRARIAMPNGDPNDFSRWKRTLRQDVPPSATKSKVRAPSSGEAGKRHGCQFQGGALCKSPHGTALSNVTGTACESCRTHFGYPQRNSTSTSPSPSRSSRQRQASPKGDTQEGSISKSPRRLRNRPAANSANKPSKVCVDNGIVSQQAWSVSSGYDGTVLPAIAELTTTSSEGHMDQQQSVAGSEGDSWDSICPLQPAEPSFENSYKPGRLERLTGFHKKVELRETLERAALNRDTDACTQTQFSQANCIRDKELSESSIYTFAPNERGDVACLDDLKQSTAESISNLTEDRDSQYNGRTPYAAESHTEAGPLVPCSMHSLQLMAPPDGSTVSGSNSSGELCGTTMESDSVCVSPCASSELLAKQEESFSILDASSLLGIGPSYQDIESIAERLLYNSMPRESVVNLSVARVGSRESREQFLRTLQCDGGNWDNIAVTWHLAPSAAAAQAISRSGVRCEEEHCMCGRYRLGGYVALSAAKANAHPDISRNNDLRHMLLVLALPGPLVVQAERGIRPPCTAADNTQCPTEYCFIDPSRLYCACSLTYQWTPTGMCKRQSSEA